MKIDSAGLSLTSSHLASSHDESQESLRIWTGNRRPDFQARGNAGAATVSFSAAARAALAADIRAAMAALPAPPAVQPARAAADATGIERAADAADHDPLLGLIKAVVEMLTGRSIRVFSAQELKQADSPPRIAGPAATAPAAPQQAAAAPRAGFGVEYDYHAVHEEFEQTQVSAQGTIKTTDGQEFSFNLELSMTRSYREETALSFRAGDAVRHDPLVLNFNGTAAQLADRRVAFDLDSNGTTDHLALLAGGSGYLAIDRNGNGKIDSGHELFGPATNSGFGELAALDSDHNGWIDENDPAFAALRIWTPAAGGDGLLESLQQRKLGALALGNVASPFELRGAGNGNLGAIAATGVFLADDGRVGSLQEIDLTV